MSFYSTFQQITLSLGICAAATVLHVAMSLEGRNTPSLPDFSWAFWIVTAISFCSVFANFRFHEKAGAEIAGAK